jgi:hypothetical protein
MRIRGPPIAVHSGIKIPFDTPSFELKLELRDASDPQRTMTRKLAVPRPSCVADFAQDLMMQLRVASGRLELEFLEGSADGEWIGLEENRDLQELLQSNAPRVRVSIVRNRSPQHVDSPPTNPASPRGPTCPRKPTGPRKSTSPRNLGARQMSMITLLPKAHSSVSEEVAGVYEPTFLQREIKRHATWAYLFLLVAGLWPSLGTKDCSSIGYAYSQLGRGMILYSFFIYAIPLFTDSAPPWLPEYITGSWRTCFSLIYTLMMGLVVVACGFVRRRFRYGSRLQCTIHRLVEADAVDVSAVELRCVDQSSASNGSSNSSGLSPVVAAGSTRRRRRRSSNQVKRLARINATMMPWAKLDSLSRWSLLVSLVFYLLVYVSVPILQISNGGEVTYRQVECQLFSPC